VSDWHDTESFWVRTAALTSGNYIAEDNLGELLFEQNRVDEAAVHFRAALVAHPEDLAANLNLGAYEDRRGNMAAAIARYKVVSAQTADVGMRSMAYASMGFVYRKTGDLGDAQECFEAALRLAPNGVRATVGLGLIAQDDGNLDGAVRQYSLAATRQPNEVVYLLLAQALQLQGRSNEATAIYERAARSPQFADAQKEAQGLLSRQ
jgi:tetratricopeptide (TPR) repeat protein